MTGLTALIAEHRNGPGGVGHGVVARMAGELVQAEVVLNAVGPGDAPVLTVAGSIVRPGQQLDTRAVVVPLAPDAAGVVLHQFTAGAAQGEGGVLLLPAEVTDPVARVVAPALVVLAGDIAAFDEAG